MHSMAGAGRHLKTQYLAWFLHPKVDKITPHTHRIAFRGAPMVPPTVTSEGEFSNVTCSCTGKDVVRYA
jgi:hypothetical protein